MASQRKSSRPKTATEKAATGPVKLLSGGNPQMAKGRGEEVVQSFIAAMPGWKQDVGRWLDALVTSTIPNVRKAVKWNTPFYGVDDETWFLGFHCLTNYVKVAFPMGAHLKPPPPGSSKQQHVRYLHIHENEELDEAQVKKWIKQAAALPGEKL